MTGRKTAAVCLCTCSAYKYSARQIFVKNHNIMASTAVVDVDADYTIFSCFPQCSGYMTFFRYFSYRQIEKIHGFLYMFVPGNHGGKMYFVSKRIEISFAHRLSLDYESKCTRLHGHNAIVTVCCCSRELDRNGMVTDFSSISQIVKDSLDHNFANDAMEFNPTAENLAGWICAQVPNCYKVMFQESEGNVAVYVKAGFEDAAKIL